VSAPGDDPAKPGPKNAGGPKGPGDRPRTAPRVTPRSGSAPGGSASLYERYKDALRRGHVAALRGRNDAAIDAYGEAASIAPDRALPHASIGGILAKMNRPADAVASYERALALAPRDEVALRGIAETYVTLGRRTAAADALDRLADTLDSGGRLADATDSARRALELAESRARRSHVEALTERLRTSSPGDEAAQRALALALLVLEPEPAEAAEAEPEPPAEQTEAASEAEEQPAEEPEPAETAEAAEVAEPVADDAGAAATTETPAVAEPMAEPEPESDGGVAAGASGEPAAPDAEVPSVAEEDVVEPIGLGIALGAAAETHLYAGELEEAHTGLLAAARAHRRAGRLSAAVDACYLAIALAPSDPDLHLLLAELYLDRGWRTLAVDKLLLLGRIAELDEDGATRDRLCELVVDRLADEPRAAALCA
jgi:tetratricopeptide (TPR) repeat protein